MKLFIRNNTKLDIIDLKKVFYKNAQPEQSHFPKRHVHEFPFFLKWGIAPLAQVSCGGALMTHSNEHRYWCFVIVAL